MPAITFIPDCCRELLFYLRARIALPARTRMWLFGRTTHRTRICKSSILLKCFILGLTMAMGCQSPGERAGGVCLSFDDRTINEWYQMIPLLEKYDAHVTFFITQADSLLADEILKLKELQDRGHEIGSHGAMHVNAEVFIKQYGYQRYLAEEIDRDVAVMKEMGFSPVSFAYPYGAKYWFTDFLLLRRFRAVRSVAAPDAVEDIRSSDEIFFRFKGNKMSALSIDVNEGLTRSSVSEALDRAAERREVLMLYGHAPVSDGDSLYRYDPEFLEFILSESRAKGLSFYRFDELVP